MFKDLITAQAGFINAQIRTTVLRKILHSLKTKEVGSVKLTEEVYKRSISKEATLKEMLLYNPSNQNRISGYVHHHRSVVTDRNNSFHKR